MRCVLLTTCSTHPGWVSPAAGYRVNSQRAPAEAYLAVADPAVADPPGWCPHPAHPPSSPQLGITATQHPMRQLRYLEEVWSENFSWHYLVYISLKLTWWWSLMGFRISHIILLSIIHHLLVYGLKCMHRNSAPLFCLFSSLHSVCSILKSNIKDLKFYISYKDLIWQLFKV